VTKILYHSILLLLHISCSLREGSKQYFWAVPGAHVTEIGSWLFRVRDVKSLRPVQFDQKDRPLSNTQTPTGRTDTSQTRMAPPRVSRMIKSVTNGASRGSDRFMRDSLNWRLGTRSLFFYYAAQVDVWECRTGTGTGRRVIKSEYIIVTTATAWTYVCMILCTQIKLQIMWVGKASARSCKRLIQFATVSGASFGRGSSDSLPRHHFGSVCIMRVLLYAASCFCPLQDVPKLTPTRTTRWGNAHARTQRYTSSAQSTSLASWQQDCCQQCLDLCCSWMDFVLPSCLWVTPERVAASQHAAACCTVLRRDTVCCSVLQCLAVSFLTPCCCQASACYDDDCFYYHPWRNNVVIAFGTLSSFYTVLHCITLCCSVWMPSCPILRFITMCDMPVWHASDMSVDLILPCMYCHWVNPV